MSYEYDLDQEIEDLQQEIKAVDREYLLIAIFFNILGVALLAAVVMHMLG